MFPMSWTLYCSSSDIWPPGHRRRDINLLQIVRLFKESILFQSRQAALALQAEFAQWDRLSDEALVEFEKGL